jgi:hypothetical protein
MPQGKPKFSQKTEKAVQKEIQKIVKSVAEDEEQVDPTVPGTKLDRWLPTARKVAYTKQYFESKYPMVTVIPERDLPVTINGVKYEFRVGQETTVPAPFAAEYHRYIREGGKLRKTPVTEGALLVNPGAGALRPEGEEE